MTLAQAQARERVSDGLDAVRLVVFLSLVIDVVSGLIAASYGVSGLGRTGLIASLQSLVVVVAVAACLWGRVRIAVVLSIAAAVLVMVLGPTGTEPWLILVTGVAIAARARPAMIGVGAAAHLVYAAVFAIDLELRRPGYGIPAAVTTLAFSAVAFAVGLIARRLLRARDASRARILQLHQQNAEIRVTERRRLADDLQVAVVRGLSAMDALVAAARTSADVGVLRRTLAEIEVASRSLSAELRVLLEVLRSDVEAAPHTRPAARFRAGLLTGRAARIAFSVACALLALRAVVDAVIGSDPGTPAGMVAVEVLGFLAWAAVVINPTAGVIAAGLALLTAVVLDPPGAWDVLPAALLCLLATYRYGTKAVGLAAGGFVLYAGALLLRGTEDPFWKLTAVGYGAVLAATVGLVVRHLLQVRRDLNRDELDARSERQRLEAAERSAVARELHDVVAHQLSVANLLVLSTSASSDPDELRETLDKIGRSTDAARGELDVLLRAMRRPPVEETHETPLVTSRASVQSLVERLAEQGYEAAVDIDPVVDLLDATTQRTLSRILQESTTNILRYASAGSRCRYTLNVADDQVSLDISSPYESGGRRSDLSSGWGLRGIRERVELVHGTFSAGQVNGSWTVSVTMPLIGGRVAQVATLG